MLHQELRKPWLLCPRCRNPELVCSANWPLYGMGVCETLCSLFGFASGWVRSKRLAWRPLNRSDHQERRIERHIAQKGARSDQSNHAVSRTPRRERSHWPNVSFFSFKWSSSVNRTKTSTSHL